MKPIDFIEAIGWGVDNGLIEYPDNYSDIVANPPVIAQSWVYVEWNGSDKPSWRQLTEWALCVQIHKLIYPKDGFWEKSNLKQHRSELIKNLNRKETGLHLGTMKDMSNLQYLAASTGAFQVEMRTIDGEIILIKTKKRLKEILSVVSANENRVHNAHNKIKNRYEDLVATAYDKDLIDETRLDAASQAGGINRNYASLIENDLR